LRFFDHCYREQVTLADGARLVLRALGPCDARLLSCHFTALSAESRWGRFLGAKSELSAADLRHFRHIDGERHFAVNAARRHNRDDRGSDDRVGRRAQADAFVSGVAGR